MGLDIVNESLENIEDDFGYIVDNYIIGDYQKIYTELIDNNLFENLIVTLRPEHIVTYSAEEEEKRDEVVPNRMEEFKEEVNRLLKKIELFDKNIVPEEYLSLAREYEWVTDDEELNGNSRMGSYSMIHYGRTFADLLSNFYDNRGEDTCESEYKPTKEEILDILSEVNKNYCNYSDGHFDNLCNHSDCDGYYWPTEDRIDFEHGSSIQLLVELDMIYNTGAIDKLKEIRESTIAEYPEISYAPEEVRSAYYTAENCEWVIRKMLYHAVGSVLYNEEIRFC